MGKFFLSEGISPLEVKDQRKYPEQILKLTEGKKVKMILNIISVILLVMGLGGMLGTVAWILRRGNSNRLTRLFIVCQLSIVLWLISQLLILFSANSSQLWISYTIGNIGISCFSPFWLMFSGEYAETGKSVRKLMKLLPIISAVSVIIIITNPLHKLYYTSFTTEGVSYGVFFYIFQVIYYICIIAGITMMCLKQITRSDKARQQAALISLSAIVPMIVNTLTLTGVLDLGIELTPLFFASSTQI